ncbi:hypothetical protein MRB53_009486 [Persea americana]|uniref:Uncharacterized protein n=1 Tax=Persea americana TaxID=3435 RepID=A0ACC2LQ95_PERAE|nr:hypothetical protein MRB53_009486 [Persea americana]
MRPFMPSFPSAPNQVQAHGSNNPNPQQVGLLRPPNMVNSSNLGSGNLTNQFPCSCPHQIPSQSHAFNNQNPAPMMNTFNNQNTHLSNLHGNGISLPNQLPAMPFPCFPNGAAGNLALQNGYLGRLFPSSHMGSSCFIMVCRIQIRSFNHLKNPIQNLNQVMPMQCSHLPMIQTHPTPFNIHLSSNPLVACPSQTLQAPGSLNSFFPVNPQLGVGNSNANPNSMVLSNEGTQFNNQGQTHQPPKNLQSSGFQQSQGSNVNSRGNYISIPNQGSPTSKNFRGNRKEPNMRFQKSKLHRMANAKGHLRPAHGNQRKGNHNKGAGKSNIANSIKKAIGEIHRYPPIIYTKEEVRLWREARKRNFPIQANMKRRQADNDAKLRRQQLREILAKQAEMGLEVAELPPNYLSESENQTGNGDARRLQKKRGKFRNKLNKRDKKHGQRDQKAKNQRSISNKREPTLLQKLLSTEINRDKSHLLQVLRFMVLNNFFKDYPEKPLEFPLITAKDVGFIEDDFFGEEALHGGDVMVSAIENAEAVGPKDQDYKHNVMDEDHHDEDDEDGNKGEELICDHDGENRGTIEDIDESESEEGEITD